MLSSHQSPIHLLMSQILTQDKQILDLYRSPKFCRDLKQTSFENMLSILYNLQRKINRMQLGSPNIEFSLVSIMNTPHPYTGLNLLDYVLISGFKDAFQRLISCGVRSANFDILAAKISSRKQYDNDVPQIITDISEIIADYEYIKKHQVDLNDASQLNVDDNCFPKLWLGVGVLCTILSPLVYPIAHGVGSILFLSIGVPSIFSGINSLQNSIESQQQREQTRFNDMIAQATEAIKSLIKSTKAEQDKMREHRYFVPLTVRPSVALQDSSRSLLFYSHSSEAKLPTVRMLPKNSMQM